MTRCIAFLCLALAACQAPLENQTEKAPSAEEVATFAERCFGVHAAVALGMMEVRGGRAAPEKGAQTATCLFMNEDGKVVASLAIGPASAVASLEAASAPEAKAFLNLAQAARAGGADPTAPARMGAITRKLRGGKEEAIPLAIGGFTPEGGVQEMGLLYAGGFAYARFFGRTERAAYRFMEQQALPALRRAPGAD